MSRSEKEASTGLNPRDQCGLRQFLKFSELHVLLSANENTLTVRMKNVPIGEHVSIWSPAGSIIGGDCGTLRAQRLAEEVYRGEGSGP